MYSYIKGNLEYKDDYIAVVDAGGIGYELNCPMSTLAKLEAGQAVKMYTYLHVREDALMLYGFATQEEKKIFELLTSVSGIGPKVANGVLSAITPSELSVAVVTNNVATLTKIPGIGAKTAQRMILELKDKIDKERKLEQIVELPKTANRASNEAVEALQFLGYSSKISTDVVSKVMENDIEDVEEIIKQALKLL